MGNKSSINSSELTSNASNPVDKDNTIDHAFESDHKASRPSDDDQEDAVSLHNLIDLIHLNRPPAKPVVDNVSNSDMMRNLTHVSHGAEAPGAHASSRVAVEPKPMDIDHDTTNQDEIVPGAKSLPSNDSIRGSDNNMKNDTTINHTHSCAIESTITCTNQHPDDSNEEEGDQNTTMHTMDDGTQSEGEDSDNGSDDNEGFDSNDDSNCGAGWGDEDDYNESSYDGQDFAEFKEPSLTQPKNKDAPAVRAVVAVSPVRGDQRAWICDRCNALNNLMDSMKLRNYFCIRCTGKYRPGQPLIEEKQQKEPLREQEQSYGGQRVWSCAQCSCLNCPLWKFCKSCGGYPPPQAFIFVTYEKKFLHRHKYNPTRVPTKWDNIEARHAIPIPRFKALGTATSAKEYPAFFPKSFLKPSLVKLFGDPYRHSFFSIAHPNVARRMLTNIAQSVIAVDTEPLGSECVAINEKNGCIAVVSKKGIYVFTPHLNVICSTAHLDGWSISLKSGCRVRYVEDSVYVFYYQTSRFVVYCVDEQKLEMHGKLLPHEAHFKHCKMTDFLVVKYRLIILYGRWLGIYQLRPKLTWNYSVAFSLTQYVQPVSMEMCSFDEFGDESSVSQESIKNYVYILCENNIISMHPTQPSFEYIHHATDVDHATSFCNSRKYGTFWINKERDTIYQSAIGDKDVVNVACSITALQQKHSKDVLCIDTANDSDIRQLNSVLYDEGYGISGRLLIQCTAKRGLFEVPVFCQVFNANELKVLKQELKEYQQQMIPWKPFDFMACVFEMLYGTELANVVLQSEIKRNLY